MVGTTFVEAEAAIRVVFAIMAKAICPVPADVAHCILTEALGHGERDLVDHISGVVGLGVVALEVAPLVALRVTACKRHSKHLHKLKEEVTRLIGSVHVEWDGTEALRVDVVHDDLLVENGE